MGDVSTEQRLQLVQQVRSRYHENQYDMFNRERVLYGRTSIAPNKLGLPENPGYAYDEMMQPAGRPTSFFKLRLFAAVILLAAVIIMDKNNIKVAGITTEKIFQVISADYEEKIEEWMEAISR